MKKLSLSQGREGTVPFRRRPSPRFNEYVAQLFSVQCDIDQERVADVLADEECRRLIRNDGSRTYLVHSTSRDQVANIMENGLTVSGTLTNIPMFWRTTVLLAGPTDRDQTRYNASSLAYVTKDVHDPAKVVVSLPHPHGISRDDYVGMAAFTSTFLAQADGEMIRHVQPLSVEGDRINYPEFNIPGLFVQGYFDQEAKSFVTNDGFQP